MTESVGDGRRPVLKHVLVREHLRALIADRPAGSPAPSERDLVARFGVARMTVRQAIEALVVEGLLERIPGKGTFVGEPRTRVGALRGFTDEMAGRNLRPGSHTLIARREKAPVGIARTLGITEGDPVIRWRRLRLADDVPIAVEVTWLTEVLVPGFLEAGLPESLYAGLEARGLRPTWAEDAITATALTEEDATLLEQEPGVPGLLVSRRVVHDDKTIGVSRTVHRADRYTLWVRFEDR